MKIVSIVILGCLASTCTARAAYAPIPAQEQGQEWSMTLKAAAMVDSNIFGSPTNAIDSSIYSIQPKFDYNGSLTDQTFLAASYMLTVDRFDNRPGDKILYSHELMARVSHAFTQATTLDLFDMFRTQKNPASLLAGLPVNSEQSYRSNEVNASFSTPITPKIGATLKARSIAFRYDNPVLANSINHSENLVGISGNYAILPELKGVGEYRRQYVDYNNGGSVKNKNSDFFLLGADYAVAKKMSLSARVGDEQRHRTGAPDTSAPYIELGTKYDYAPGSFISGGYVNTYEETSNVALYTDTLVNRYFVNVQHAVTALITASASVDYEPSKLKARPGFASADENSLHAGVALTYLMGKAWTFSATYDRDHVTSDDISRKMSRDRLGLSAVFRY